MIIKIKESLYKGLIKDCKERFPKEACGLVAGLREEELIEVKKIFVMTNIDDSSEHFTLEPQEQFAVIKEIRELGYELIANYHSHPYTPARPSKEDKILAYSEELLYFIISLLAEEPVLKAFEIREREFVKEVELEII